MYALKTRNGKVYLLRNNQANAIKHYAKFNKGYYKFCNIVDNNDIVEVKLVKSTNFDHGKKYANRNFKTLYIGDNGVIYNREKIIVKPKWVEGYHIIFNYEDTAFVCKNDSNRYCYFILGYRPRLNLAFTFSDAIKYMINAFLKSKIEEVEKLKSDIITNKEEIRELVKKLNKLI